MDRLHIIGYVGTGIFILGILLVVIWFIAFESSHDARKHDSGEARVMMYVGIIFAVIGFVILGYAFYRYEENHKHKGITNVKNRAGTFMKRFTHHSLK